MENWLRKMKLAVYLNEIGLKADMFEQSAELPAPAGTAHQPTKHEIMQIFNGGTTPKRKCRSLADCAALLH